MTRSERAMQVWQVLISAASQRRILTYGHLAEYLEFDGAGVFSQILDRIMQYCDDNKLPPLTCIVVNRSTGLPGSGLSTIENLPRDRENVFSHNWFAGPLVQIRDFE